MEQRSEVEKIVSLHRPQVASAPVGEGLLPRFGEARAIADEVVEGYTLQQITSSSDSRKLLVHDNLW